MPKGGGRFRKIPGGIRKFPLLFSRRVCYTMGVVERRLPARCDGSFLSSHFVIGDVGSVCEQQASRLPSAAGSWKWESALEATHLAVKVQVITGLHGSRGARFLKGRSGRSAFFCGSAKKSPVFADPAGSRRGFRKFLLQNPAISSIISKCVISGFLQTLHLNT